MAGLFVKPINGVLRTVQIDQEVSVGNAATNAVVTFPSALQTGNASPRVTAWLFNSTDTNPRFEPVLITARSSTGFTATWSTPTDSANYKLGYMVVDGWVA